MVSVRKPASALAGILRRASLSRNLRRPIAASGPEAQREAGGAKVHDLIEAATAFVIGTDREADFMRLRSLVAGADAAAIREEIKASNHYRWPYDWAIFDDVQARAGALLSQNWCWPFGLKKIVDQLDYLEPALSRLRVPGASTLDFGAGGFAPHLLSSYLYANGAERCLSLEPQAVVDPATACRALREFLVAMVTREDRWLRGEHSRRVYLDRIGRFDFKALDEGDIRAALAGVPIEHRTGTIQGCPDIQGLDFVFSVAVLEHVFDLDDVFAALHRAVKPDGLMCHVVDFSDHDFYSGACSHRWGYLTKDGGDGHGVNRVRLSAMTGLLERSGFETVEVVRYSSAVPPEAAARLRPEYRSLSQDDLETYCASIVSRRSVV